MSINSIIWSFLFYLFMNSLPHFSRTLPWNVVNINFVHCSLYCTHLSMLCVVSHQSILITLNTYSNDLFSTQLLANIYADCSLRCLLRYLSIIELSKKLFYIFTSPSKMSIFNSTVICYEDKTKIKYRVRLGFKLW